MRVYFLSGIKLYLIQCKRWTIYDPYSQGACNLTAEMITKNKSRARARVCRTMLHDPHCFFYSIRCYFCQPKIWGGNILKHKYLLPLLWLNWASCDRVQNDMVLSGEWLITPFQHLSGWHRYNNLSPPCLHKDGFKTTTSPAASLQIIFPNKSLTWHLGVTHAAKTAL